MMKQTKAFTLVDLVFVVVCIVLLAVIFLPTLSRPRRPPPYFRCLANLNGIYKGWILYGSENNDAPPILPDIDQATAQYAEDLRMGDECTAAALGTGAQQNLCLFVEIHVVPWKMLVCPSADERRADRTGAGRKYGLGETGSLYCSYGIQIPYAHGGDNSCPVSPEMDDGIVILGDRAPAGNLNTQWSRNHPKDGESLLYADGRVKFSKDKRADGDRNTGGWGGNNVYTRDNWDTTDPDNPVLTSNGSAVGYPNSTRDTVLYSWQP